MLEVQLEGTVKNNPMVQTGKDQTPHLRVFLASTFQAVAHKPQETALPTVSLTQHTLYCLLLRVKGNQRKQNRRPGPPLPCFVLAHTDSLCDLRQVASPL